MRRIVFGRQSQRDLQQAWDYIATDNVKAADMLIQKIQDALELLAEMPGIGHRRDDIRSVKYRCWMVRPYVIVYRYSSRTVTVVRVIHGARDFRKGIR